MSNHRIMGELRLTRIMDRLQFNFLHTARSAMRALRWLKALFSWVSKTSQDSDSKTSLGRDFQYPTVPIMKRFFSDIHSEPHVSVHNHLSMSCCHAPLWRSRLYFLNNYPVSTQGLKGCPYVLLKTPLPHAQEAQFSLGSCSSPDPSGPLLSLLQLVNVFLV